MMKRDYDNLVNFIKDIKILENQKGAVFDVPIKDKEIFLELAEDGEEFTLEVAKELPKLHQ